MQPNKFVIPAQAGIHFDFVESNLDSLPAFAGTKGRGNDELNRHLGFGRRA